MDVIEHCTIAERLAFLDAWHTAGGDAAIYDASIRRIRARSVSL